MVVREIKIIKKFRDDPPPDHPINFSPLKNLHLELMENKNKLKPGVPVNPVVKEVIFEKDKPRGLKPRKETKPGSSSSPKKSVRVEQPQKESSRKKRREKNLEKIKKSVSTLQEDPVDPEESEEEFVTKSKSSKHTVKPTSKSAKTDNAMIEALKDDGEEEEEEEFIGDEEEEEEFVGDEDVGEGEYVEEDEEEEDDEFAGMTPEEKAEYEHKEYLWRFRILKKKYKNAAVPVYNQHSDLDMMKRDYERIVRELQLDDSVDTYKQYLFGGFMAIELVCTQFIGIDLSGFTSLQSRMMPKYERMLIELGEKSYTTWGSSLPVEIRLIGFVLLQAGIFFLAKVIADKFGETAADLFKGFMGQPPDTPAASKSKSSKDDEGGEHRDRKKKKKMRGPRINVSNLRNKKKEE